MAFFDIAYLRCLPNMVLMAPRDEAMLVHMLHTALGHDGPVALRYPRGEAVGVPLPDTPQLIAIGTGEILREAPDSEGERSGRVALVGYGTGVGKALGAAALLEVDGIEATVADARFAKPIDSGLIAQLAAEHELLVTIEEGILGGGFGNRRWETPERGGRCADSDPSRRRPGPLRPPTARPSCFTRRSATPPSGSPSESVRAIDRPSATFAGR